MNATELNFIKDQSTDELYVLVSFPDVQYLMEYSWFRKECILHNAFDDQEYLDSTYFVPVNRMLEVASGDLTNFQEDH